MTVGAPHPIFQAMALSQIPSRLFRRFIAAMLLVMICVHAVTPLGQPARKVTGSAFSAETHDVSLRSGQYAAVIKQVEHAPYPAILPETPVELSVSAFALPPVEREYSVAATGPPPLQTRISPLSARAPPAV